MSPSSGTGMSPSYPHSEPSPDPMGTYGTILLQSRTPTLPNSDSPPSTQNSTSHHLHNNNNHSNNKANSNSSNSTSSSSNTSSSAATDHQRFYTNSGRLAGSSLFNGSEFGDYADTNVPSTLMGQFMEALNNQPNNLDDLGLNIESFHGGLECNVDEVSETALYTI